MSCRLFSAVVAVLLAALVYHIGLFTSPSAVAVGENESRWSDLRRSVPLLLGLSVSGATFCGVDIGGSARPCGAPSSDTGS